jgi:hypothetical protein
MREENNSKNAESIARNMQGNGCIMRKQQVIRNGRNPLLKKNMNPLVRITTKIACQRNGASSILRRQKLNEVNE